jgi:DNA-binding transcriptional regulator GbsR (MarR family)
MGLSKQMTFRVDEEVYNAITELAEDRGISKSDLARMILSNELSKYYKYKGIDKETFEKYIEVLTKIDASIGNSERQLYKIGNNLNQMAKIINTKKNTEEWENNQDKIDAWFNALTKHADLLDRIEKILWKGV